MVFALVLLLMGSASWAGTGTSGANFLEIPIGAEPAALGSAYTARAETAYATVWNPAALARLETPELAAMHVKYIESVNYNHFGVALPFSWSEDQKTGVGVAAQVLDSGSIERRLIDGTVGGTFKTQSAAYTLGIGQSLGPDLSLGGSLKAIQEKIDTASASAYAMDLGLLYYLSKTIGFGATIQNVGTSIKFVNQEDPLPLQARLGVDWRASVDWRVSLEGVYRRDGPFSGHGGLEWTPTEPVAIRTGYQTSHTKELGAASGFTAGVGLRVYGQEIAYAWVPFGDLGQTHYLSLNIRWSTAPRKDRAGSASVRRRLREEDLDFDDRPRSRYSDYRNVYDIVGDEDRKSLKRSMDKDFL